MMPWLIPALTLISKDTIPKYIPAKFNIPDIITLIKAEYQIEIVPSSLYLTQSLSYKDQILRLLTKLLINHNIMKIRLTTNIPNDIINLPVMPLSALNKMIQIHLYWIMTYTTPIIRMLKFLINMQIAVMSIPIYLALICSYIINFVIFLWYGKKIY